MHVDPPWRLVRGRTQSDKEPGQLRGREVQDRVGPLLQFKDDKYTHAHVHKHTHPPGTGGPSGVPSRTETQGRDSFCYAPFVWVSDGPLRRTETRTGQEEARRLQRKTKPPAAGHLGNAEEQSGRGPENEEAEKATEDRKLKNTMCTRTLQ